MVMSSTYIQDTKYQVHLLKIINTPKSTQKIGLSIYKKNLEINIINEDNIDLLLNSDIEFIESKVNIGFVFIGGVSCFLYACNSDIKKKGKLDGKQKSRVYKIKKISCIPLSTNISSKTKSKMNTEFKILQKFLKMEGLYFCENPLRFDIDIKGQIENFQDINIKYKLFENFQYNYNFAPYYCQKIICPIVKGYFTTIHYNNSSNEKGNLNIAMRYKIYDSNKYIIEIELFISPTKNSPSIFQNIFYAYFNELDDKGFALKKLLDTWSNNLMAFQKKENFEKYGLIINFNNNKNDINFKELQNLSKYEIISLNKIKNLENTMNKLIESFKGVEYSYKYNNIEYKSQNKLLILISDDYKNLLSMIKIVSSILFSIFLQDRKCNNNIINNTKEEIFKEFKKVEKKAKKLYKEFPKSLDINKINDSNIEKIRNNNSSEKDNILIDIESEINFDINQIDQSNIIENKTIKLFIGTFNVNALEANLVKTENLSPFLFPEKLNNYFNETNFPIFYCIGLEETVELNPKNVLIKPKNRAEIWEERISSELQKKFNYYLICQEQLVGILLLFYVKSSEIKYINNIQTEKLKSGFMGCGNKGCCFLSFQYKGKQYGFCSCHLPAGEKKKNLISRKDTFNHILAYKVGKSEIEFQKNDFYFIFGDLNFRTENVGLINLKNHRKIITAEKKAMDDSNSLRINVKNKEMPKVKVLKRLNSEINFDNKIKDDNPNYRIKRSGLYQNVKINYDNYLTNNNIILANDKEEKENLMDENSFKNYFFHKFLESEELKIFKKTELVKFNIEEGEINFPPTYKYKKNTNFYNISKRVPSWTDRILYKNSENIKSIFYDRIDINLSDHKPIVGFFEINNDEN